MYENIENVEGGGGCMSTQKIWVMNTLKIRRRGMNKLKRQGGRGCFGCLRKEIRVEGYIWQGRGASIVPLGHHTTPTHSHHTYPPTPPSVGVTGVEVDPGIIKTKRALSTCLIQ